jgi:hypothetical protein
VSKAENLSLFGAERVATSRSGGSSSLLIWLNQGAVQRKSRANTANNPVSRDGRRKTGSIAAAWRAWQSDRRPRGRRWNVDVILHQDPRL